MCSVLVLLNYTLLLSHSCVYVCFCFSFGGSVSCVDGKHRLHAVIRLSFNKTPIAWRSPGAAVFTQLVLFILLALHCVTLCGNEGTEAGDWEEFKRGSLFSWFL